LRQSVRWWLGIPPPSKGGCDGKERREFQKAAKGALAKFIAYFFHGIDPLLSWSSVNLCSAANRPGGGRQARLDTPGAGQRHRRRKTAKLTGLDTGTCTSAGGRCGPSIDFRSCDTIRRAPFVKTLYREHRLALIREARVNALCGCRCALSLRILADLASNLDSPPAVVQHNDRIAFNRGQVRAGDNARHVRTPSRSAHVDEAS
jgi:hypothetical protein